MSVINYNMRKAVEETIKVAEKAEFEARRAHARIDALPKPEPPAAPQKGERGATGATGRDGRNGVDGRNAVGIQGPPGIGRDGAPGRDAPQRVEFDNLRIFVKRESRELRVIVATQNQNIELLRQVIVGTNEKTESYLAFLAARLAQRLKDHQQ